MRNIECTTHYPNRRDVRKLTMIDAGIQHPTARHTADTMFASLRRWTKSDLADNARPGHGV